MITVGRLSEIRKLKDLKISSPHKKANLEYLLSKPIKETKKQVFVSNEEVWNLTQQGLAPAEVAEKLNISKDAVFKKLKRHRSRISTNKSL